MKHVYTLILSAFFIVFLNGCANDLDVAATYKDIPVLYGKLSANDSIQYIRIQKGFLSNNTDANVMAKYRDSIYYPENSLLVVLTNANGSFKDTLKRLNGNDYGIFKDTGIFYSDQNILYRATKKLSPLNTYKITCTNLINKNQFSATTNTIGDFEISSPNTIPPITFTPTISFSKDSTGVYQNFNMSLIKRTSGDNDDWSQYTFGVDIVLKYDEWYVNNPSVVTTKSVVWKAFPLQKVNVYGKLSEIKINGGTFFSAFSGLKKDPNIIRRLNPNAVVKVKVINKEYTQFVDTRNVQSNSISSDEAIPIYTNVVNGIGLLYGETNKEYPIFVLSSLLYNYIACDKSTLDYNFLNAQDRLCR